MKFPQLINQFFWWHALDRIARMLVSAAAANLNSYFYFCGLS
jgi:hypothetical protein